MKNVEKKSKICNSCAHKENTQTYTSNSQRVNETATEI
jgi:hypothetical protein